tara:strand:+ start:153 stop:2147 length:1995 start_codon:yes stop_codon:yes gene_type:complete
MKKTLFLLSICTLLSSLNIYSDAKIPLQHFICDPAMTSGTLSPDGKYFAAMVPASGPSCAIEETDDPQSARVLLVINLETNTPTVLSGTKGKSRLTGFYWLNNTRIGFSRQPEAGLDAYSMWAINIDGTKPKLLVAGEYEDGYPTGASMIDRMPDDDRHVLVSYNKRRPTTRDVYKLNIFSGKLTLVAKDPYIDDQRLLTWVTDQQGVVRGYYALKGLNRYLYHRNDADSDFKLLRTFVFQGPEFVPAAYSYDPRYVYMRGQAIDKNGVEIGNSDTAAIWLYDSYEDEFVEKIYQHPKFDVSGIAISEVTEKPIFVYYVGDDIVEKVWLDEEFKQIYASIEASFPSDEVQIGSWTDDEGKAIVYTSSDVNPGAMYFYDRKQAKISFIAKQKPWIDSNEMSPMLPISFEARDGLEISGYLTIPKNSNGKNLPLIVNPHGGPTARDYWGFNFEHQFFASRGYAVLSMNFRGSTGYGRKHIMEGNKQWGRKMQDDVTDSVKWAVNQGIANPSKVCIYGASYGGYAVMAGITKTPELYKCAVNYVGVTDMELLFSDTPVQWEHLKEQQKVYIGDYENEKEYLDAVSPINLVDRIDTPLYIVHGVRDWRVPIKHAQRLRKELEKNGKEEGKDFWWLVKTDEGHGFYKEENKMELYSELEIFFDRYLNNS